ncbi:MAG: HAMP domain-containing protein [Terriglobia bacterium]
MAEHKHLKGLDLHRFPWRVRKPLKVFAPGTSLRKRVAYSLVIVRLILVPVIALAVYYLFAMGWIVDRIVRVDAQVATLAESVSIQMLNARRMELNYFLLHDAADLKASHDSLDTLQGTLNECAALQPSVRGSIHQIQTELQNYRRLLDSAVTSVNSRKVSTAERFHDVVQAYEKSLNTLLGQSRKESRAQLLDDLRNQSGSFDSQVAGAIAASDPGLRQATEDLEASSDTILELSTALEVESWNRVRQDHQEARHLLDQAEWMLAIVSALVFILSLIVSYILPRQVVKPLMDLKAAVDHAAAGNYEIEFDVQGKGEVAQLAHSVQDLITHVSQKQEESKVDGSG